MLQILLQLIVMIGAARLMNIAFRRLSQPGVIGEIVAGLLLGPTLFGHVFPQLSAALFGATASLPIVVISQLGLILLMFQIGADFEFEHLRTHGNCRSAILIAAVSVAVPFTLGFALGRISASSLAPSVDPLTYSLFLGVALSITALPILGRILREFGLARTELGVVAIAAAALNDVAGWVMLAAVAAFASARFSVTQTVLQLGGLAVLALVLRIVLWPLKDRLLRAFPSRDGSLTANLIAIVLCLTGLARTLLRRTSSYFRPSGTWSATRFWSPPRSSTPGRRSRHRRRPLPRRRQSCHDQRGAPRPSDRPAGFAPCPEHSGSGHRS